MASKLQCIRNLFTTLLKNKPDVVTIVFNLQETRINLNDRLLKVGIPSGGDQLRKSMDRFLEQKERDSVRNTMLKQEEIFKEQVHELHRLYRVQKMLMAELRNKNLQSLATATTPRAVTDSRNRLWSSTSTSETSHSSYISSRHQSTAQRNSEYSSLNPFATMAAEDTLRKQKGFDLELPAEEETTISLEQSKDSWLEEESEVELTLSIGRGSSKKKLKHWLRSEPAPSGTNQLLLPTTPVRPNIGDESSERESLQKPPWLFQAMSLNRA